MTGARRQGTAGAQPQGAVATGAGRTGSRPRPILLQEGVPTFERINGAVAEPVVYLIDRYVVGGLLPRHAERGADENLNSPGRASCRWPSPKPPAPPGRQAGRQRAEPLYMYGVIARLAMVAASYELKRPTDAEIHE